MNNMGDTFEGLLQKRKDTEEFQMFLLSYNEIEESELISVLLAQDSKGFNYSLKIAQDFKVKALSPANLRVFLLCLLNLQEVLTFQIINSEITSLVLKLLDQSFDLANLQSSVLEMKELLREYTFSIYAQFGNGDSALGIINHIRRFFESLARATLKILQEHINSRISINSLMRCSMTLEELWGNNITQKVCSFLLNFVQENISDDSSKLALVDFITSKITAFYPHAEEICNKIDEMIPTLEEIMANQRNISNLAQNINETYSKTFSYAEANYQNTKVDIIPNVDDLLCCFLHNFLVKFDTKFIQEYIFSACISNSIRKSAKILPHIRKIFYLPLIVQYAFAEILCEIHKMEYQYLNYFYDSISVFPLHHKNIPENWAREFLDMVCKPPFDEVLKFYSSGEDLLPLIHDVTYNIVLMDLPEKLLGLNLKNRRIIIKIFHERQEIAKAATFCVYLQKLAHFLRRKDCFYISECSKPLSAGDADEEGAKNLEKMLFGQILSQISYKACEYLLSNKVCPELKQFQKEFQDLNPRDSDIPSVRLRMGDDNQVFVGGCLSLFTPSNWMNVSKNRTVSW